MTDRESIYNLVDKVCDLSIKAIDKITELKQENSKLKQRVAELEKPKKKRKFRAMTNEEYCNKHKYCNDCPEYKGDINRCYGFMHGIANIEPYRTTNGKYILIKVKE